MPAELRLVMNCLGRAVLKNGVRALLDLVPLGSALFDISHDAYVEYQKHHGPGRIANGLEALAQAPAAEVRKAAEEVAEEIAADQPPRVREALAAYLNQVPQTVRRSLRPSALGPDSVSMPRRADDLVPLLPARLPRFKPGDRPLPGVDWELVELLGMGGFGEVWKAVNPFRPNAAPVALKFCLDAEAAQVLRNEADLLDRVESQGQHPGIVALRHTYLSADPPCLEYEYVAGGDLAGLVQDWRQQHGGRHDVAEVNRLMRQLAEIVAFAHRVQPPIVHRDLKPANVLLHVPGDAPPCLKVADFGIGGVAAQQALVNGPLLATSRLQFATVVARGAYTPLFASPQQVRGEPPDPRDDVHALGVIWYQLLTANLTAGRPAGSAWQKRLLERGMPAPLLEVLLGCLEDEAEDRWPDAGVVAERFAAVLGDQPAQCEDLAEQLGQTQQKVARAHDEARRLADQQHDYASAARVLETVRQDLRDAELYRTACHRRDRVARLDGEVRRAVQAVHLDGVRPLVEELLRLQPQREDLRKLLDRLSPDVKLPRVVTNSIGMKFVLIPPGVFLMGTPSDEEDRSPDEGPQHDVEISRPVYLGEYQVTQQEYARVTGQNPSWFFAGGGGQADVEGLDTSRFPVECVSWNDAAAFCRKLSELPEEKKAGRVYRLPTEAEWEYACREAGRAKTPFYHGHGLSSLQANFNGHHPYGGAATGPNLRRPAPVGSYVPNALGLFDMHGNVAEWCSDWYDTCSYATGPCKDPQGPEKGDRRILRGGSWVDYGRYCRAGRRNHCRPTESQDSIGFRAALVAAPLRAGDGVER